MIIANITSFIGLDAEAEHFYCKYKKVDEMVPGETCSTIYDGIELERTITKSSEVKKLNKKDRHSNIKLGSRTYRFNTIDEIHNELKSLFPTKTIVTYQENKIFKDMLYWKNGENLGIGFFGNNIWNSVPTSCYSDLLPPKKMIQIKCNHCGTKFNIDDVSEERYLKIEKRSLTEFLRKYELVEVDPCCKYFDLEWNVIL